MMEFSMSYVATVSLSMRVILALVTGVLAGGVQAAESSRTPIQLAVWNPMQISDSERSVGGFRYSLLWGVNRDVVGLDLSTFASKATGDVRGVQSALLANLVIGSLEGYQFSLLLNQVNGKFSGLQLGGLNFASGGISGVQLGILGADTQGGHMRGIQVGMAGSFADEVTGFQGSIGMTRMTRGRGLQIGGFANAAESILGVQLAGLMNVVDGGDTSGPQFAGIANVADDVYGAQISSIVNIADDVHGAQITSIVNVARDGEGVQIAALVNVANDMKGLQLGLLNFNKNGFLPFFPLFNFGF
jgi:hypothetical protein